VDKPGIVFQFTTEGRFL